MYEREIESLLWENLEAFVGEPLFPLARQARLPGGGVPDLLALDAQGRVVVIEVKRDIDRGQLAQCLEYAGWARTTGLDELAGLYRPGPERFFIDWQDFTGTTTPTLLDRVPRLILVARSFDPRTDSALQYLKETGVPWKLIQVVFYEDMDGKRVVDVNNGDLEGPSLSPVAVRTGSTPRPTNGSSSSSVRASSGVTLTDLLERGVLQPDEPIVWRRPQVGEVHHATIGANGEVRLQDGRSSASLSMAAVLLVGGNYNGWECWTVPRLGGVKIGTLRNVPAPPDGG